MPNVKYWAILAAFIFAAYWLWSNKVSQIAS